MEIYYQILKIYKRRELRKIVSRKKSRKSNAEGEKLRGWGQGVLSCSCSDSTTLFLQGTKMWKSNGCSLRGQLQEIESYGNNGNNWN